MLKMDCPWEAQWENMRNWWPEKEATNNITGSQLIPQQAYHSAHRDRPMPHLHLSVHFVLSLLCKDPIACDLFLPLIKITNTSRHEMPLSQKEWVCGSGEKKSQNDSDMNGEGLSPAAPSVDRRLGAEQCSLSLSCLDNLSVWVIYVEKALPAKVQVTKKHALPRPVSKNKVSDGLIIPTSRVQSIMLFCLRLIWIYKWFSSFFHRL